MRLPHLIKLPFGYTIKVYLISDKEMLDYIDEVDDKDELCDGLWDSYLRMIYIRKKLPFKRRIEVLGHEMDHALNDWRHWAQDTL